VRPAREKLSGAVEVDETYVGGIAQGKPGRGAERKFVVAIAIELLDPKGFGRVRLRRVEDVSSASLVPFVEYAVEPGSEVRTDGWNGYKGLAKQNYHHVRSTCRQTGDPAHVVMPGVHTVASLLKRWLLGNTSGSVTPRIWTRIWMSSQQPTLQQGCHGVNARHDDVRRIARCRQVDRTVMIVLFGQSLVAIPAVGANL